VRSARLVDHPQAALVLKGASFFAKSSVYATSPTREIRKALTGAADRIESDGTLPDDRRAFAKGYLHTLRSPQRMGLTKRATMAPVDEQGMRGTPQVNERNTRGLSDQPDLENAMIAEPKTAAEAEQNFRTSIMTARANAARRISVAD
jgi:hypothetical protein